MTTGRPSPSVPTLRFPEFRDGPGWTQSSIGSFLRESRIRSTADDPARRITVRLHLQGVEQREIRGTEVLGSTTHYSRAAGQFIYGKQNIHKGAFGLIPDRLDGFESSQDLPAFDFAATCNAEFFFHSLSRRRMYSSLANRMRGTGSKRLSEHTFLRLRVALPSLPEQQRITDCLGSLDDLIAAEHRKLTALRQQKRGLLRHLFPQEGSAQPALRFSQYRNAEAWKVTRLGDIAAYENGKAYEKDIVDDGRLVVVNARFISTDGAVRKYTNKTYCVARTGDVLMVLSDLPSAKALARCFLVDADETYAVNQRVARLRPRSVDSRFLLYALDKHPSLMAFSDGINQTHLSRGAVLDCPVAVPRDDGEQKRIAECLGTIDSQVTAQEAKLAALTRHKHGLLQQLFPSPEEESR